jgi:hypothetical protein
MSDLVQQPYDKYWDSPPTRREMQRMANKLAQNDSELMGMADTCALILNFICEVKLLVKREEIEVYVEAKKLQLAESRAKMKTEAEAQQHEQPHRQL